MDRVLIVMDNVSGVADNCKNFADFLTVSRKYKHHCLYVFHVITPEIQIWKKNLSQTNIFNIFPLSVTYNTVSKILQSNCKQTRKNTFQHVLCGYIGSSLTLLISIKDIA